MRLVEGCKSLRRLGVYTLSAMSVESLAAADAVLCERGGQEVFSITGFYVPAV